MRHGQPPARLLNAIRRSRRVANPSPRDQQRICDAYREILREYRTIASAGRLPGSRWRAVALEARAISAAMPTGSMPRCEIMITIAMVHFSA